jgi:hypothetical protein
MIDKNFLYTINSIVNYYVNADADPKRTKTVRLTGKLILEKINDLFKEEEFFEEWGVYEKDTPTVFSDDEKKLIYQLIAKAEEDYLKKDVDITTILDAEDFDDIKNKVL